MLVYAAATDRIDRSSLKRLQLLTHAQARTHEIPVGSTGMSRRSTIWPWLAIGLSLIFVLAKAGMTAGRGGGRPEYVAVAILVGLLLLFARWITHIRPARQKLKQIHAPFAFETLSNDRRLPVVLLRSFASEAAKVSGIPFFRKRVEEVLVRTAKPYGPAIAIGAPEDELPQLGAARAYIPGSGEWEKIALEWMASARMIVMLAGSTPGLLWELERIIERGQVHKTIVMCPGNGMFGRPSFDEDGSLLFAQRIAKAAGCDDIVRPEDVDGVIAIVVGGPREMVLIKARFFGSNAYRRALERAIVERFCRDREAEVARAVG